MKKIFLITFLTTFFAFGSAQNYFLEKPEGFGAGTTGGGSTAPITVSTYNDLKNALKSEGEKVILVSGEITIPAGQPLSMIIKNKSLIGLPGAKLINETQAKPGSGILYLKKGSSNVIIRNLTFIGPGAYDINGNDNLTADGCTNLWVDHCDFRDGQDGNLDIKGLSDNITVSWTKFSYLKQPKADGIGGSQDHRFSNLIGSSAKDAPEDGHFSVTFQNCYWADGARERMPRARNSELHILSSYYNTSHPSAKAIGLGGGINNSTCYVENTHFAKVKHAFTAYPADGGTASVTFVNSLNAGTSVGTVAAPSYRVTAIPVNEVEKRVSDAGCGAGATLQVSADGIISPAKCTDHEIATTLPEKKKGWCLFRKKEKTLKNR